MRTRLTLAAVALVAAVGPGWGANLIRCTPKDKGIEPVTITLDAEHRSGRTLSCISGGFIADMTPCAPNGAFSLSAPTGSAAIVGLVTRWQDYANHMGGVVGFSQQPDAMSFTGGFNSPDTGLSDRWTFAVDRISGMGTLRQDGKSDLSFTCRKVGTKI